MTNPFVQEDIPRRVKPLFFLLNTSDSMRGPKIAALNTALREMLDEVSKFSEGYPEKQINVAVLGFSSAVRWMYPQLEDLESFQWQDLQAGGFSSFGAALIELNNKLSRSHGFISDPSLTCTPIIILITDSEPTDDYKPALEQVKNNPWFKIAVKAAVAVGDDANKDVLAEFTSNIEAVFSVHDIVDLMKVICRSLNDVEDDPIAREESDADDWDSESESNADYVIYNVEWDSEFTDTNSAKSITNTGTDTWDDW